MKSFLSVSDFQRKNFVCLSKSFWRGCQNCILSRGSISRKAFLKKFLLDKLGFSIFLRPWAKSFRQFLQKLFGVFIKTVFYVTIGSTWWKKIRFSPNQYPTSKEKKSSVSQKKLAGSQNCFLKVPTNVSEENHPSRKNRSPYISRLEWKLFWILLNFSGGNFKTAIYKSIQTI